MAHSLYMQRLGPSETKELGASQIGHKNRDIYIGGGLAQTFQLSRGLLRQRVYLA